jgi:hypothetical protein
MASVTTWELGNVSAENVTPPSMLLSRTPVEVLYTVFGLSGSTTMNDADVSPKTTYAEPGPSIRYKPADAR